MNVPSTMEKGEKQFIPKTSVVCEEAELRGYIRLGENNMVHPKCRIISETSGEILIGNNNIFEENATIINRGLEPLIIGNDNVFEVGCIVEGTKVGNGCLVEAKASIARGSSLGNNCVVGPLSGTQPNEIVPDNTVIYGDVSNRQTQIKTTKAQTPLHFRHIEYLNEVLPKYHHRRAVK
ncbi:Dynactin subunit 6 [Nowakowskiella sp. JEL0407]|nr:Dynactin subunit 6 [Nowakowskiella sp. JEL0407]